MDLVVHHHSRDNGPRDDIRLWNFSMVQRRLMGNTARSWIKYLCHDQTEIPNKEACVCALILYRVNKTAI
jgi:hypothetical protein